MATTSPRAGLAALDPAVRKEVSLAEFQRGVATLIKKARAAGRTLSRAAATRQFARDVGDVHRQRGKGGVNVNK